jgi:hypothetical protein
MDYHPRQTRRLFLSGAVPFPTPFPCVGALSFEHGQLIYDDKYFDRITVRQILVDESPRPDSATRRVFLARDLSAVFISSSNEDRVTNFEDGVWILPPYIDSDRMEEALKRRDDGPPPRGIVFLAEDRSVLTLNEVTQTAGAVETPSADHYFRRCDCCDR